MRRRPRKGKEMWRMSSMGMRSHLSIQDCRDARFSPLADRTIYIDHRIVCGGIFQSQISWNPDPKFLIGHIEIKHR
jgi:hypothetical protein